MTAKLKSRRAKRVATSARGQWQHVTFRVRHTPNYERTGPSRSGVPTDPDQPFRSIPISLWTVWRGVNGPVG